MENKEQIENVKNIANAIGMEIDDSIAKDVMDDKQIEQVANVLRDNRDPIAEERMNYDSEEFKKFKEEEESKTDQKAVATIAVNPASGAGMVVSSESLDEALEKEDNDDYDIDLLEMFREQKNEMTFEQCKKTFAQTYGIEDEISQRQLFNAIMSEDEVKFEDLPTSIRSMITISLPEDMKTDEQKRKEYIKDLLDNMRSDLATDNAFLNLNRVLNSAKAEINKAFDEVMEFNREKFEVESLQQATVIKRIIESFENSTDIKEEEKAKLKELFNKLPKKVQSVQALKEQVKILEQFPEAFRDSYTYESLRRDWKTLRIKGRKVTIKQFLESEVKYYNKYVMEFDNRYRDIELGIHSSSLIVKTLCRLFPNEKETDLRKFVILFCMVCRTYYKPKNIVDHIRMYYTIQNIISMDAIQDKTVGMPAEIIKNIQSILDDIIK